MAHHRQTQEVTVRNTRLTHRWMLAFVLACLALAAVAVSAPAATRRTCAARTPGRSPRSATTGSYGDPVQDLRSPDARDAANSPRDVAKAAAAPAWPADLAREPAG